MWFGSSLMACCLSPEQPAWTGGIVVGRDRSHLIAVGVCRRHIDAGSVSGGHPGIRSMSNGTLPGWGWRVMETVEAVSRRLPSSDVPSH